METVTKTASDINSTVLTLREMKLWNMIRTNSGVVMAIGIPGISKSATFRCIAKKLDLQYIDVRLATKDETDLGVYPSISEMTINGVTHKVVDGAVPAWAIKANSRPTLIHFEELNRCSSPIRNAALGILLERIIGENFTFNNDVYMVASGNPSTDVDADVETFGTALRNRAIFVNFELKLDDWVKEYATAHVHPTVISFLKHKRDYFGNSIDQMEKYIDESNPMSQYPSPRSWTFLSDYIKAFPEEMQKDVMTDTVALTSYVGELAAVGFVNYVVETYKVDVKDVLSGKADFENLNSMTVQRICQEFAEGYKYLELNEKQRTNWKLFMRVMSDEILAAHAVVLVNSWDHQDPKQTVIFKELLQEFSAIVDVVKAGIKKGS